MGGTPRLIQVPVSTAPLAQHGMHEGPHGAHPGQHMRAVSSQPVAGPPGTPHSHQQNPGSVTPSPQQHQNQSQFQTPTPHDAARRLSMPGSMDPTNSNNTGPGPSPSGNGVAVPPFASMETPSQPPWAQVVPPPPKPTAREQEQLERDRRLLQDILVEVRTMSVALADSAPANSSNDQGSPNGDGSPQRGGASKELRAQIEAKDKKLDEFEQKFSCLVAELSEKEDLLGLATREREAAEKAKKDLEEEHARRLEAEQSETKTVELLTARCSEVENLNQELVEKLRRAEAKIASLQAGKEKAEESAKDAAERSAENNEAVRRVEGEKRALEAELAKASEEIDRLQTLEQETRKLRCREAVLEDELRDLQEKRQQAEAQKQALEQDCSSWQQRCLEEEQKYAPNNQKAVWDLEMALHQERKMASLTCPGDILKVINHFASSENMASENDRLKMEVFELRNQLRDMQQVFRGAQQ